MIVVFAAVMVVNAFAAVVAHRKAELHRLWLLGATPEQVEGSVLAEARIVAGVGVALGLLASLATIVPFAVARARGSGPRRAALAAGGGRGGRGRADSSVGPLRCPPYCSRGGLDRRGPMTDWASMASPSALLQPIRSVRPAPVDGDALVDRLRLTAVSLGYALLMAPALALGILTILAIPLGLVAVGFVIAAGVVPATAALTALHRRLSGELLGEKIHTAYADTTGLNVGHSADDLADRPGALARRRVPLVLGDRRLRDVDPAGGAPGRAGHARGRCPARRRRLVVAAGRARRAAAARLVVRDPGAGPRSGAGRAEHPRLAAGRGAGAPGRGGLDVTHRDAGPQRRGGAPDRARPARRRPGPDRLGRHERRPGREADRAPTPRPPRRCCARHGRRR